MSLALDIIEAMINETAEYANRIAVSFPLSESFGAQTGPGMRLMVLQETKTKVMRAEAKALETERDSLPGWYTG